VIEISLPMERNLDVEESRFAVIILIPLIGPVVWPVAGSAVPA